MDLRRFRRRRVIAPGIVMGLLLGCGGAYTATRSTVPRERPAAAPPMSSPASPSPATTPTPVRPKKLNRARLTRAIDRYLARRSGNASLAIRDLSTRNSYRYHADRRFVTASCVKIDILMTLLLRAQKQKRKLTADERRTAELMIRYSDNKAADRLWERIGGPAGMTAANRRFGVRHTRASAGRCLDLYCWGITDTTAAEQIRLLRALVSADSPLTAKRRRYVLGLMSRVIEPQAWGVSAAAGKSKGKDRGKGARVALKNGWQRRLAHGKLWAINSVGRVQTGDHDFLIAVLTDHNPTSGYGIETVEHIVELAAREFRTTTR